MKSKPQWDVASHVLGRLLSKKQKITSVGKDVKKREYLYTVGRTYLTRLESKWVYMYENAL